MLQKEPAPGEFLRLENEERFFPERNHYRVALPAEKDYTLTLPQGAMLIVVEAVPHGDNCLVTASCLSLEYPLVFTVHDERLYPDGDVTVSSVQLQP